MTCWNAVFPSDINNKREYERTRTRSINNTCKSTSINSEVEGRRDCLKVSVASSMQKRKTGSSVTISAHWLFGCPIVQSQGFGLTGADIVNLLKGLAGPKQNWMGGSTCNKRFRPGATCPSVATIRQRKTVYSAYLLTN